MICIFYTIMLAVCVVWGMWLRYTPFKSIIKDKQRKILFAVYAVVNIANVAIIAVGMYFVGVEFAFNYFRYGFLIYPALMTIVNIFLIPKRLREHIFVFGIVLNCHYLLMYFPNCIIESMNLSDANSIFTLIINVYAVLLMLTYLPLRKLVCTTVEPFLGLETGKYWNNVCVIPLLFFATRFVNIGGEHNNGSLDQLVSGVVSGVLMVFICLVIAQDHKFMVERIETEEQLSNQKLHYAEMQARVENARKQKHDMKHHITAIRRFIELDDKEGLSHFCDDLSERNNLDRASLPYTGNVAVDGVVYRYMQLCEENNVEFNYSGVVHSKGIADIDLCVLLGNALDNALAACLTIPDNRSINVFCQSEEALLSIVVNNTFDGNIKEENNEIISRKRGDRPGVGLSSMRSICEHYNGNMETAWDEKSFNLMIMLPVVQE